MNFDFNFDAAIFDMDGTLLDSMRYWRYTSLEYMLAHQWPVEPEDLLKMHDTSSRRLLSDIAAREGFDTGSREEMIAELESYMNRHYLDDVSLKDAHIPAFLEKLQAHGMRMCVATGSPRQYARNGLARVGILKYLDFVTDNYEFPMEKDKPEYFVFQAKRLGTTPERCVVFEDALYALRAAKAAGCRVVGIEEETARRQREDIMREADWYIRSYSELLN